MLRPDSEIEFMTVADEMVLGRIVGPSDDTRGYVAVVYPDHESTRAGLFAFVEGTSSTDSVLAGMRLGGTSRIRSGGPDGPVADLLTGSADGLPHAVLFERTSPVTPDLLVQTVRSLAGISVKSSATPQADGTVAAMKPRGPSKRSSASAELSSAVRSRDADNTAREPVPERPAESEPGATPTSDAGRSNRTPTRAEEVTVASWPTLKRCTAVVRDVTLSGRHYVDLRRFYEKDGELKPGREGVMFSVDEIPNLIAALTEMADRQRT